jgi:hypothetical protein
VSEGRFPTVRRSAGHYSVTDRGRNWEIFKITSRKWIAYEYVGEGDETVCKEACTARTLRDCLSHIKTYGSAPDTPKEAPVARTAKPNLYTVELRRSIVPNHVGVVMQLPLGRNQANVHVVATSAKAARARLEEAGWFQPTCIQLASMSNEVCAMIDAGLLEELGEIVCYAQYFMSTYTVRIVSGEIRSRVVGRWKYVRDYRGVRVDARCFVRNDGAHFPARVSSAPGTPFTGWTPES